MTQVPLNEQLGYERNDKVVIIHIDDIGFSHSSNVASFECLDFGIASCGSLIVPSPWFLEAVAMYKKNPIYDLGVHLTLTCEYNLYRWRALSTVDESSGLLDAEKCLWRTSEEAIKNVSVKAAEAEMRAQIERAIQSGIKITHIDSHMGAVMHTKFIPTYLKLAREYGVAAFLPRPTNQQLIAIGMGDQIAVFEKMFDNIKERGIPVLDHMVIDTGGERPNKIKYYCKLFSKIEPGVTHLLFHSA
ncbi:MAG: polysaccharide deacetylase family protein, partial [Candidatus Thorarchaeota archaeon]